MKRLFAALVAWCRTALRHRWWGVLVTDVEGITRVFAFTGRAAALNFTARRGD